MEREFSAPLHHTQFGNHLKYKSRTKHANPKLQKLVDGGMNIRTAYSTLAAQKANRGKQDSFDYEAQCPKGEWV